MKSKRNRCNSRLDTSPLQVARLFAAANLTGTDHSEAEVILSAIAAGDYQRGKVLCDAFARPEFGSAPAYFARKQFTALLTKVPFTGNSSSRQRKSLSDFFQAELRCRLTNKRLRFFSKHPNRMPEVVRVVYTRARGMVHRVLGVLTDSKLDRIIDSSRPGGGVSIGTHNRFRVSLPFKLGDTDLAVTDRARSYARMLVEGSPAWLQLHAEVDWEKRRYSVPYVTAESNRITFVPKDARSLRTIAIEPALNVCLQLGVHSYIASRLKEFGNDIEDQSRNQKLALRGSLMPLGDSVSTLDLSQASDSLSTELVKWLLPWDWFLFLDDIRCHTGVIKGEHVCYEKFSSMGNGFTFSLETLIFWSLCEAVRSLTGGAVSSCYGDDIIIEDNGALLLLEVLRFSGFKVNPEKSFVCGPFRESCGADWYCGLRVTPQYIRTVTLRCTDVYNFLNRLDPIFNHGLVRDYLLSCHREKEPVLYGLENEDTSSCLFASFDYVKGGGLLRWKSDWQRWTFSGWTFCPEVERVPSLLAYAAALKGSRSSESRYQLRGRGKFRIRCFTQGINPGLPRLFV
jgi:hypothetical protein